MGFARENRVRIRLPAGGKRIRTLGPRYIYGVCETVLGVWCAYAFRPERPTRSQGDRRLESAFLWHRMSEGPCSLGNLMPWRRLHVNPRDPFLLAVTRRPMRFAKSSGNPSD